MLRWMGRHAGRREGSSERLRSARRGQKRAELSRNYRQSTINVPSTRRGARGLHTHLWLRMLNGMRGRQGFSRCAEVDASSTVQGTAQCRREIFRGIVPSVIRSESGTRMCPQTQVFYFSRPVLDGRQPNQATVPALDGLYSTPSAPALHHAQVQRDMQRQAGDGTHGRGLGDGRWLL